MTQMTEEGMPGSENNPLATTLPETGSRPVNSVGVQEYPNLYEGSIAEAATLQANDPTILAALKSGTASPTDYAKALAASTYEGYDPAANAAYANSYLQDAGQPEESFPGGSAPTGYGGQSPTAISSNNAAGATALNDAASSNLFGGLSGLGANLGAAASAQQANSLQQALSGLSSNPEATTEQANTINAPGSPDAQTPDSQKLPASSPAPAPLSPANYQALLAALVPGIAPGTAGKGG